MRIKLDENIPTEVGPELARLGHDLDTVAAEGLAGRDDGTVWSATQQARRLLVTQDLDFSDMRRYQPGTHHGVVLMRLRVPKRKALIMRIVELFEQAGTADWAGNLVVVTERKVRVRRPPSAESGRLT